MKVIIMTSCVIILLSIVMAWIYKGMTTTNKMKELLYNSFTDVTIDKDLLHQKLSEKINNEKGVEKMLQLMLKFGYIQKEGEKYRINC